MSRLRKHWNQDWPQPNLRHNQTSGNICGANLGQQKQWLALLSPLPWKQDIASSPLVHSAALPPDHQVLIQVSGRSLNLELGPGQDRSLPKQQRAGTSQERKGCKIGTTRVWDTTYTTNIQTGSAPIWRVSHTSLH